MNKKAEEIRVRYLYRNLILKEKIKLPYKAAVKLVGPDCAYHLYSIMNYEKTKKRGSG